MIEEMKKLVEEGFSVLIRYGTTGDYPGWLAHIYTVDESHPLRYPNPDRSYKYASSTPENAWAGALEKFNGAER